jgi:hypothetical protein
VAFRFLRSGKTSHRDDPYWNFFINTPPADLTNTVTELLRNAPEGNLFPTKADIHTPEITSSHVKDMARYFGAALVGIAKLDPDDVNNTEGLPFAVICAVPADYDPRESHGIGGQVPVQNGLFISFVLSAWIRELGFRATAKRDVDAETLAAQAKLGNLNSAGRLVTPQYGTNIYVANAVFTDLPLAADG